jgi:hypothetical protein
MSDGPLDYHDLLVAADYLQEARDFDGEKAAKFLTAVAREMNKRAEYRYAMESLVMASRLPRSHNGRYVTLDHEGLPRIERSDRVQRVKFVQRSATWPSLRHWEPINYETEVVSAMPERTFQEIQAELRRYGWKIAPIEGAGE